MSFENFIILTENVLCDGLLKNVIQPVRKFVAVTVVWSRKVLLSRVLASRIVCTHWMVFEHRIEVVGFIIVPQSLVHILTVRQKRPEQIHTTQCV